ncbi:carbohydrate ABC transporter permease [Lichenicoccus sp.]|uniref:carbohydrate ABC transporter permease n=1 Tax=Lichenicoccus sp. TaxID=2781899 RepID=UPI003D14D9B0
MSEGLAVGHQASLVPAPTLRIGRRTRLRRDGRAAVWFLLPGFAGLAIFLLLPLAVSLLLSFTNWSLIGQPHWIGLRNFEDLFAGRWNFWPVLEETVLYTVEYLALNIVISIAMAVWIDSLPWGRQFFRVLFFLPSFVPLVGSAVVWMLILTPGGAMDWVVHSLHLQIPNLITDPALAMQAIILVSLWSGFGYNLLLFSAALGSIPASYLDAAKLDGANAWQRFWRIKLPLISPTLLFGIVMTAITALQVFDQVYALTRGGPGASTYTMGFLIYHTGFERYRMGTASAIAWVLFALIMMLTAVQMRLQNRWVHYDN